MRRVLGIDADIALVHMIEKGVREKLAPDRVVQADVDVVVTGLQAEHCLARQVEQGPIEGARRTAATVKAIVVLMELIAVDRISGVPAEVAEQVQGVFDNVSIRFPQSYIIGLGQPG